MAVITVLDPLAVTGLVSGSLVLSNEDGKVYLWTEGGAIPVNEVRDLTTLDDSQLEWIGNDWVKFGYTKSYLVPPTTPALVGENGYEHRIHGYFSGAAQQTYVASATAAIALADAPALSFASETSLDPRITVSGGANGSRVNSSGVIVAATAPRYDYNPVTLAALGIIIEGARTNEFFASSDLSAWTQVGTPTLGSNTVAAPDGTTTADSWTRITTSASFAIKGPSKAASSLTYTLSEYVDSTVGNYLAMRMQGTYPSRADVSFNQATNAIASAATAFSSFSAASASIAPAGGNFSRAVLTATTDTAASVTAVISFKSNTTTVDLADSANNSAGVVWGTQIEQGDFASSYIFTTSAAVTRSADSLTMAGSDFSDWWDPEGGTIILEGDLTAVGTRTVWQADDGTANNRLVLYASGTSLKFLVVEGGVTQSDTTLGTVSSGTTFRAAVSFTQGAVLASLNGAASVSGSPAALPVVDRCLFGSSTVVGEELFGHLLGFSFLPYDTDVETLSS